MNSVKGHIVDVVRREIFDGELVINNGIIAEVKRCTLPEQEKPWGYVMPGFIDSHVHIESSMMVPHKFARIAVSHGTIGVVADPHEIGNVLGIKGIDYMIRSGKEARFNFLFGAPSCVPAVGGDIETSGAVIDAKDIEVLMAREDIGFLAEMMNYLGVLAGEKEVMQKIDAARRHGKPVDGHAPGLTGSQRKQYADAGISTDHECSTLDEGRACIDAGMKVIIREGSAAKDYQALSKLIAERPDMVMLCTDDCHPDDFVRGHINQIVKRALVDGYDLWDVLQVACVNAQKHYNVNWGLLQVGDPATFITIDRLTPHFRVESTVIRGVEAFNYNACLLSNHSDLDEHILDFEFPNDFVAMPITAEDIDIVLKPGDNVHIIHTSDGSLLTEHEEVKLTGNPLFDSHYPWTEVQKIVVYNRYVPGAKPIVGLVRGFDVKEGAIASSVAHDCHNIVAIGSSDEYIVQAVNRIVEMQGGQVVVSADEMMDIPLPIAGLMAPMGGHEIAFRTLCIQEMVKKIGCQMKSPFITMAFMCLPVIPDIKMTDKHLMDTKNFKAIY
ncbi:adenine deaminase [Xylanibacter ruminicola]|uniref:adenine deaminase n=1 Tax=Xylanibacter ruminicola TaxID=839 RepID=UPI00048FD1A1|nr:adenine deaminase [Xylanibacter ruminicola]